jgi:hypothetical protein
MVYERAQRYMTTAYMQSLETFIVISRVIAYIHRRRHSTQLKKRLRQLRNTRIITATMYGCRRIISHREFAMNPHTGVQPFILPRALQVDRTRQPSPRNFDETAALGNLARTIDIL